MRPILAVSAAMAALALCLLPACASYTTPGGPADFHALGITKDQADAMTDVSLASHFDRKPAAGFPASIAAVRVQAPGYQSYTARSYGNGRFSVVTVRDVETDEQFARLNALPMVRGIAPINRLLVPDDIQNDRDLRSIAAMAQADITLIYTFDTIFGSDTVVPALGTITLGIFPAERARVTSTASAAFIDTRTGYIYGLSEATAKTDQLANAWTTREAIDQSRRRAETEAFDKLVVELEKTWKQIVVRYGPPGTTPTVTDAALSTPVRSK
jgi:hypothetical protein